MTRKSSSSTKYLLRSDLVPARIEDKATFCVHGDRIYSVVVPFSCSVVFNIDNSSKSHQSTLTKMKGYRLLEQGEPASDDREIRPTARPCYQASQPILIVSVVLGAMLLLLSAGGNLFQYWYSGYGNDDTCRSQIGGSAALDGVRRMLLR